MAIAKIFKNRIPNARVFHPDGRMVTFVSGKCITTVEKDIKYLQSLVDEGDAYVYIDPKEAEIDTEEMTEEGRLAKLKREAIAEFLEAQKAAASHNSSSTQGGLNAGTSATLMKEVTADIQRVAAEAEEKKSGVKVNISK